LNGPVSALTTIHYSKSRLAHIGGTMRIRYRDFKWTANQIVAAILDRNRFMGWNGFSGESCSKCKKTANVLGHGPGWFCICGAYNCQSWSCNQGPHERPDLGPSQHTLNMAHRQVIHPPNVAKYLWVRARQAVDQKWQVTMTDSQGATQWPTGYLYQHEGSPAEMDAWIEKIKDWPQHRDFTLQAVAV